MASHDGFRVVITGAASGIGLATALAFADAGGRVFISDVDPSLLDEALADGRLVGGVVADVADAAAVDNLFETALAALGGLDCLVANAGIAGPTADVENISLADWRRCLEVNLDGAFLSARRAIPALKRSGGGSIINLSSTGGLFGFPGRAPYCSAKWAIRGFTKTLAQELGPFGIRANCICPGSVAGPRIDRVIAAEASRSGVSAEEVRASYASKSSLKTLIDAADIAATILFLTSAAGARVSGQEIAVDGHTETL